MPEAAHVERWSRYVAEYHEAHPGITEDLLTAACDDTGRSPYDWLVEAVPASATTVIDLACGSMPLARRLAPRRVVGVDQSPGELSRAAAGPGWPVRGRASALPVADGAAGAVVCSMALMLLHPLEPVLREVARALGAGGTFAATVPVRAATPAASPFGRVLAALGQDGEPYPEALDGPTLAPRLASAGLGLRSDETTTFRRDVDGPADAERVVRSFYAPGAGPTRVAAAVDELRDQLRAGPVAIDYRVRRLVARR